MNLRSIRWVHRAFAGVALSGAAVTAFAFAPDDELATRINAHEVKERLTAVEMIRRDGAKDGEKLLLGCLDDRDWEVIEKAAAALGERGTAASFDPLAELALEGPVRRIRVTAARSLAKLDAKAAADHLNKAAKGATLLRACEGLAAIADVARELARRGIEAGLKSAEPPVRATAAAGLVAFPVAERTLLMTKLLEDPELTVGAAALESARANPDAALLPVLLRALGRSELPEVFERRIVRDITLLLAATPKEGRAPLTKALLESAQAASGAAGEARYARLLGQVAEKPVSTPPEPLVAADAVFDLLQTWLVRGSEPTAAAATRALGRVASAAALDQLATVALKNSSPRVRSLALHGLVAGRGMGANGAAELAKGLLADADADVREDAAVVLGVPGVPGAVAALLPLLQDAAWPVAVAAAVSLGKTQDAAALAPLTELAKSREWKLRDAALVGLGHLKVKAAVPVLIDALGGKDMTGKLTAFEFLRRLTRDNVAAKEPAWKSWWQKSEAGFQFPDSLAMQKQQEKYGYASSAAGAAGVYEDLDVIVFQSRGDHIEKLLDVQKIEHRNTHNGGVAAAGVEPLGVYVANCTGEATADDLELVRWFVHTGGYLYCSCWALTFHAAEVRPGFARQLATKGEVLDLVIAEPCGDSPFLAGVFDGMTRPKYVLEGSHLIDVLDLERVEVLIDSPECATRWGGGNLAAWWTVGHGLILDSANHFDLQGLARAIQLKEGSERMAYAVDTMGMPYSELREIPKKTWDNPGRAAEEVRDLSAFRFITNFVRAKRRSGA